MLRQVALSGAPIGKAESWRSDRLSQRDAARQPLIQGRSTYAIVTTCGGETDKCIPIYFDRLKISLVFRSLFKGRGPSAIAWRIIASRIFSINGMIQTWALTHIFKECGERSIPSRTHGNAARSIFGEIFKFRIVATPLHTEPNPICRAFKAASAMAMFHGCLYAGDRIGVQDL